MTRLSQRLDPPSAELGASSQRPPKECLTVDPIILLTVLAILAVLAMSAFIISRGFGRRFKGWGIELRIEKQK